MENVKVDRSDAYTKNKCKMHLVHLYLNRQLSHRRTVAVTETARNASCDVECYTKSPPAGTEVIWTSGENMKGPPAGEKTMKVPPAGDKTMKGPPAGTEALPASRIGLVLSY